MGTTIFEVGPVLRENATAGRSRTKLQCNPKSTKRTCFCHWEAQVVTASVWQYYGQDQVTISFKPHWSTCLRRICLIYVFQSSQQHTSSQSFHVVCHFPSICVNIPHIFFHLHNVCDGGDAWSRRRQLHGFKWELLCCVRCVSEKNIKNSIKTLKQLCLVKQKDILLL